MYFAMCNPRIRSPREDSCYLELISSDHLYEAHKSLNYLYSQAGCCSSHFFFLLRQVMQPVLVRLLNTLFRLGATWTAVPGRSEEYAGEEAE